MNNVQLEQHILALCALKRREQLLGEEYSIGNDVCCELLEIQEDIRLSIRDIDKELEKHINDSIGRDMLAITQEAFEICVRAADINYPISWLPTVTSTPSLLLSFGDMINITCTTAFNYKHSSGDIQKKAKNKLNNCFITLSNYGYNIEKTLARFR